jgi:hypothetical protein
VPEVIKTWFAQCTRNIQEFLAFVNFSVLTDSEPNEAQAQESDRDESRMYFQVKLRWRSNKIPS